MRFINRFSRCFNENFLFRPIHMRRPCRCHRQQHQEALHPKKKCTQSIRKRYIIPIQSHHKSPVWDPQLRFCPHFLRIRSHQPRPIQQTMPSHLVEQTVIIYSQVYSTSHSIRFRWKISFLFAFQKYRFDGESRLSTGFETNCSSSS